MPPRSFAPDRSPRTGVQRGPREPRERRDETHRVEHRHDGPRPCSRRADRLVRETIRRPDAARIEPDVATERRQAIQEVREPRLLPHHVDIERGWSRHQHTSIGPSPTTWYATCRPSGVCANQVSGTSTVSAPPRQMTRRTSRSAQPTVHPRPDTLGPRSSMEFWRGRSAALSQLPDYRYPFPQASLRTGTLDPRRPRGHTELPISRNPSEHRSAHRTLTDAPRHGIQIRHLRARHTARRPPYRGSTEPMPAPRVRRLAFRSTPTTTPMASARSRRRRGFRVCGSMTCAMVWRRRSPTLGRRGTTSRSSAPLWAWSRRSASEPAGRAVEGAEPSLALASVCRMFANRCTA